MHISEESHKVACNISHIIDELSCTISNKEEDKVSNVNVENCLSLERLNKLEIYTSKNEEETQGCNDDKAVSKNHQDDSIHECPTNVALPSSSLLFYKGDYNTKADANRSLQSTDNGYQLLHENAHMSNLLSRRKEEHMYNMLPENKRLLGTSDSFLLNLNKEDKWHKGMQNLASIEQCSKNREEEYHRIISNVEPESVSMSQNTSANSTHSTAKYSSQYNVAKYEGNEKYAASESKRVDFSTPSLNDMGKTFSSSNRLIVETPMKHMHGTMHPNPCTSHKQLFRTPQNKLSSDLSKGHIQTPSTILSSWCHNTCHNTRHTPMDGKSHSTKDCLQTSKNTVYAPVIGRGESSRCFGPDMKSARRPLTDAKLTHSDSSTYPLEVRPLILQKLSETKRVTSEVQQDDRSKKTVGLSEVKLTQREVNYDKDLKSTNLVEETKENKQPNLPEALLGNDRKIMQESNQVIIGSSMGLKVVQEPACKYNIEDNVVPNTECRDSQDHLRQREGSRQIVDKVGNVQFSVPSNIPQQRQRKTLFVKDREYLILGSLGQGMSGEVLRVQDLSCGELRAIKCVNLNKMDKESAQGCLDEISLLHKLQAPCVVRMFDYQIRESMVHVVMEMGDTDLSRLLKSMSQEKQIPLTMILYYWTEMLTAVKHIHNNGVIHSDLKPANFLLVRGRLKLIDFGIASNINSDMTSVLKNNPIGTLNYISPEALMDIGGSADSPTQNVKYKISFKSDVWSLGCILYSLVYGHTPFHHIRSQWAKVNAITNPKPNISFPAATFSNEFQDCERAPPVLIDVMRKCLQHDPKARPTVSQLLQVQYVPTKQNVAAMVPDIPANILIKIRHTLNEEEWRHLIQVGAF
ncbi:Dual specificity protein kinase TTK [Harpegnathos saltator]|uniref:Dual specificity protein kinase TTK n=1 Tax=Harpegnathos saltator TaxID=610380 RepID=E2BBR1_HARSA|nr:Dual specificity protein kinase TTK [Harpegnathos saltator]